MTKDEFNKAPKLDQILYDCTGMLVENHSDIAEAMQKYADQQLLIQHTSKLLFCSYCGNKRELIVETDINSSRICKSGLCTGK